MKNGGYPLHRLRDDAMKDFSSWKKRNPGLDLPSYAFHVLSLDQLIAAASILWPEIHIFKECMLLRDGFEEHIFDQWFEKLDGNLEQIERVMNHRHVSDLLEKLPESDPGTLEEVGRIIQSFWQASLKCQFKAQPIEVVLTTDEDEQILTIFQRRN